MRKPTSAAGLVIAVTGGAEGIGRAIAEVLAATATSPPTSTGAPDDHLRPLPGHFA